MGFLYPEQFSVFLYGLRFSDVNPAKTTFPETTRDFLEELDPSLVDYQETNSYFLETNGLESKMGHKAFPAADASGYSSLFSGTVKAKDL